jgi:hypothetical protein
MECEYCESDRRKLWPANRAPKLEEVAAGNWQKLLKCSQCKALWVEVPYEPYASYKYVVLWPFGLEAWTKLDSYDKGYSIQRWHHQTVMEEGPKLAGKDQEAILAHQRRTSGLEPYGNFEFANCEPLEEIVRRI